MRTERLGNLEHFFDSCSVKGNFWKLTELPEISEIRSRLAGLGSDEVLALYWNNPYGLHAICSGEFGFAQTGALQLSRSRMEALMEMTVAEDEALSGMVYKWYYPYPAVEFPVAVFSDNRLPVGGECDDNRYNFHDAALELFDEREMTDRLLETGQYPFLAHAYMLVISPDEGRIDALPEYTRFSNERREEMKVRTDLYRDKVVKSAFSSQSALHVGHLLEHERKLSGEMLGLSLLGLEMTVNRIRYMQEDGMRAEFDYVDGESLETRLDRMVNNGEGNTAANLMLSFVERLRSLPTLVPFESSYDFRRWFGDVRPENITRTDTEGNRAPVMALPVADIDMIPQNILLTDTQAVLIDYEWTFDFPVPIDYIVFRFLYFYLEGKYRTMYKRDAFEDLYKRAGFTEDLRQNFMMMETHFQEYVQQAALVLRNEYDIHGQPLIRRWQIQSMLLAEDDHAINVIYPSKHEESISSVQMERGNDVAGTRQEVYHYKIPVTETGEMIVVLPQVRLLRIGILSVSGGRSREQEFLVNGNLLAGCVYSFEDIQPKLSVEVSTNQSSYLMLSLEEIPSSADAYTEIRTAIEDYKFLAENRDKQLEALKSSASWKLTRPLRSLRGEKEGK